MPKKSRRKKLNEIHSAAKYAFGWLKDLPEYIKAGQKCSRPNLSEKEKTKYRSIYGFLPEELIDTETTMSANNYQPRSGKTREETVYVFPLGLLVALQNIEKVPFDQEGAALFDPLNYDLFGRTKDGKLIDPNGGVCDGLIGSPPKRISLSIYWDYPLSDIMNAIETRLKKVKYLHQIPDNRPRNNKFILRVCNKKGLYSNKRIAPETLSLEINWALCPSIIIKKLRPIIDCVRKKYRIKDSRPRYRKLADRYRTHVLTKLDYPRNEIEKTILDLRTNGKNFDIYRKRAYRMSKKGISKNIFKLIRP